ncbi:hypothetical protein [Actinosynnema sp. NPDC020468]|uniref:hypothetical protein n=1 Tax=Actinosynnema sp. NPDC020468 TaxID=3154488 RepID=UPI0033C6D948
MRAAAGSGRGVIVVLVVDGFGPGVHRLVLGDGVGRPEHLVVAEAGWCGRRAQLADVVVEGGQPRASRFAVIVAALGFPAFAKSRAASS